MIAHASSEWRIAIGAIETLATPSANSASSTIAVPEAEYIETGLRYRLAGQTIASNVPLPLPVSPLVGAATRVRISCGNPQSVGELRYEGPGWIGGCWRTVRCWNDVSGYYLAARGSPAIRVDCDSRLIVAPTPEGPDVEKVVAETVLGPCLALALSDGGTFCLHASAVRTARGRCVALAGESGVGKSTLAASPFWQRLTDDISPWRLSETGGVELLPDFPQLKLACDEFDERPARLVLDAVFFVERSMGSAPAVHRLESAEALRRWGMQSVAARLLSPAALARQFEASARAVELVPVYVLSFPDDLSLVAEIVGIACDALGHG